MCRRGPDAAVLLRQLHWGRWCERGRAQWLRRTGTLSVARLERAGVQCAGVGMPGAGHCVRVRETRAEVGVDVAVHVSK